MNYDCRNLNWRFKAFIINKLPDYMQKTETKLFFYLVHDYFFLLLRRVSPARPAPVELPQGRKAARVNGRSGAMQVAYPLAELAQLARARDL
jgi:hypothetical protein